MKSAVLFVILFCLAAVVAPWASADDMTVPSNWDWRDVDGVDYLSAVGNTTACGSSYILAPVAVVEARYRIAVTRLGGALPDVDYSEQHIMSCGSGWFGDFGCNGGYCLDVFTHIRDNGVPSEDCMNYSASDQDCPTGCPDSADEMVLHWPVDEVGEFSSFPSDAVLMQEIHDNGPVATSLDLYEDLYSYSSGVYEYAIGSQAGSTAVMIVGWGDDGGSPYWICRNVWGAGWGDGGDFLIARNAQHAGCEFGERAWMCTIDTSDVANVPMSMSGIKALYR